MVGRLEETSVFEVEDVGFSLSNSFRWGVVGVGFACDVVSGFPSNEIPERNANAAARLVAEDFRAAFMSNQPVITESWFQGKREIIKQPTQWVSGIYEVSDSMRLRTPINV